MLTTRAGSGVEPRTVTAARWPGKKGMFKTRGPTGRVESRSNRHKGI